MCILREQDSFINIHDFRMSSHIQNGWCWKGPLEIIWPNPLLKQVHLGRLPRAKSRQLFNTSENGDSTTSLSNLCWCLLTPYPSQWKSISCEFFCTLHLVLIFILLGQSILFSALWSVADMRNRCLRLFWLLVKCATISVCQFSTFFMGTFLQAAGIRLNMTLHYPAVLLITCLWGSTELCLLYHTFMVYCNHTHRCTLPPFSSREHSWRKK